MEKYHKDNNSRMLADQRSAAAAFPVFGLKLVLLDQSESRLGGPTLTGLICNFLLISCSFLNLLIYQPHGP